MMDVDQLLADFMGEDPDARKAAAEALSEIEGEAARTKARAALLAAMESVHLDVRISAAEGLGKFPESEIIERLCRCTAQDDFVNVRQAAARALGDAAHPDAVPTLITAMQNDELKVVRAAAKSLGQIGDPRAVDALLPLTRVDNPPLAQIAVDALAAIADRRAIPALTAALEHWSWLVRQAAAQALITFDDPSVLPALKTAFENEENRVAHVVLRQAVETFEGTDEADGNPS